MVTDGYGSVPFSVSATISKVYRLGTYSRRHTKRNTTITIVRNYEHYAQQAGVSPHWIQKITEEIGYRIEKVKRKF